jgi:replicative DNA helicase
MMYFVKDYARFENLTSADKEDPFLTDGGGSGNNGGPSGGNDGPPPMPHSPAPDEDAPF